MKKNYAIAATAFLILFLSVLEAYAEEDRLGPSLHTSLKDQVYVVETTEEDATESLNRVAGHIDVGFSGPSQSYSSASHAFAGALGLSDQYDKSTGY
jgi:hypothetical protein